MLLSILDTQPTDIWHDPLLLTILGIAATLLAGIIGATAALLIYKKQINRKEISYEIVSDAPVASVKRAVKDKVEIVFNGVSVGDISLVVLKIINSGNSSISSSEFETPITFVFRGQREVLESDILNTQPKNLLDQKSARNLLTWNSKEVILKPTLLNINESITISILLSGLYGEIDGRARIIGGKLVEWNRNRRAGSGRHWLFYVGLGMLSALVLWVFASYLVSFVIHTQQPPITGGFGVLLLILFVISLITLAIGTLA